MAVTCTDPSTMRPWRLRLAARSGEDVNCGQACWRGFSEAWLASKGVASALSVRVYASRGVEFQLSCCAGSLPARMLVARSQINQRPAEEAPQVPSLGKKL